MLERRRVVKEFLAKEEPILDFQTDVYLKFGGVVIRRGRQIRMGLFHIAGIFANTK